MSFPARFDEMFRLAGVTSSAGLAGDDLHTVPGDKFPDFPALPVTWDADDRAQFAALDPVALEAPEPRFTSGRDALERLSQKADESQTNGRQMAITKEVRDRAVRLSLEDMTGSLRFVSDAGLIEARVPMQVGDVDPSTCRAPVRVYTYAFDVASLPVMRIEDFIERANESGCVELKHSLGLLEATQARAARQAALRYALPAAQQGKAAKRTAPRAAPAAKRRRLRRVIESDSDDDGDGNFAVDDEAEEAAGEGDEEDAGANEPADDC
jgi:hypothetical protein